MTINLSKQDFQNCLKDLIHWKKPYKIKLKEGAVLYLLCTPRNMAIPLRERVKTELDRMEANSIISRVTEQTYWCARMVVVTKRDGSVSICVDLMPLNQNVLRELHPNAKLDKTLAQMAGASRSPPLKLKNKGWVVQNPVVAVRKGSSYDTL